MEIKQKNSCEIEANHRVYQEPFQRIKDQSKLKQILSSRIPKSTHIYNMAATYHKFLEEMEFYRFGDEDPWILAIYRRDDDKTQYCISIPNKADSIPSNVKEAFQTTKRIDWENYYEFMALEPSVARLITEISLYSKRNPITIYPCSYYWMDRKDVSKLQINVLPSGYEMRSLETDKGAQVLALDYHGTKDTTITYLKKTIERNNYALGIFHNDEPVCRVCLATTGHIGILWTKEEHRRKGLSTIILQKVIQKMIEDKSVELIPCAMADIQNVPSNLSQIKAGLKYSHYNEFIIFEGNKF